jgi:hypothetical protein
MAAVAAGVELIGNDSSSALRLAAHAIGGLGLYAAVVLWASKGIRSDLRAAVARGAT